MDYKYGIPKGLLRCESCGEYKGQVTDDGEDIEISCICDGILCPQCGKNKIHRPISNSYDPASDKVVHYSSYSGIAGCKECRIKDDLIEPKEGYLVSNHAHLGPPLVLMKPHEGETAEQFAKRVHEGLLKALEKRKKAGL